MKSIFRGIFIMTIVCTALFNPGCAKHPPATAKPVREKIAVARVNGTELYKYSLDRMIERMSEINSKTSSSEPLEETRKKALDQLIFRELAFQEAEQQGLSIEEQRLDNEMNKFITSVGHEEGYKDFLERQNLTPVEVRSQIERSLLLQLIAVKEVMEKVSVSDDDVRKEYERQKEKYVTPEKVAVVDVLVLLKQDDPALMRKANELLVKINADKDKNPWNLVTEGTFTVRSLDLDKNREPALYDAARKLEPGALSGVITASDGVHIIRLTRYTPAKQATYEEVKGSLKQGLLAVAQIKRFQEWERELKKDAKIEIMDFPMPPEHTKP